MPHKANVPLLIVAEEIEGEALATLLRAIPAVEAESANRAAAMEEP